MKNQSLLERLGQRHRAGEDWLPWLAERLPEELSGRLASAQVQSGTLRLACASAAWAARLRYALGPLEAAIRERDPDIVKCVVSVSPARR